MTDPGASPVPLVVPPPPGARRRAGFVFSVPVLAALAAAASLPLPLAGPVLLAVAAAHAARTFVASGSNVLPFLAAALVAPAAVLAGAVLSPGGAWQVPCLAVALVSLPALGAWAAVRAGRPRDEAALVAGAMAAVGLLSIHAAVSLSAGTDAGAVLSRKMAQLLPDLFRFYREQGVSEATLTSMGQVYDVARRVLENHLAGLLMAASVLFGALVVYPFGGALFRAAAPAETAPFAAFRTPPAAAVAFVPLGAVAALGPGEAGLLAADLLLPLGALFFLRGLAIIRSLLVRGAIGLFGRALVYLLVLQMPVPVLVALGGLFDEFFDFRRIGLPKEGEGGSRE